LIDLIPILSKAFDMRVFKGGENLLDWQHIFPVPDTFKTLHDVCEVMLCKGSLSLLS